MTKKQMLSIFTKEQLCGLIMHLGKEWNDAEGTGADLLTHSPQKAQEYFEQYDLKLPYSAVNRTGVFFAQIYKVSDSARSAIDRYYIEEFREGIKINEYYRVIFDGADFIVQTYESCGQEWRDVIPATEEQIKEAYNIIVAKYP